VAPHDGCFIALIQLFFFMLLHRRRGIMTWLKWLIWRQRLIFLPVVCRFERAAFLSGYDILCVCVRPRDLIALADLYRVPAAARRVYSLCDPSSCALFLW